MLAGKLLQPLQQRFAADDARHSLDKSGFGIGIHCQSQRHEGCADS